MEDLISRQAVLDALYELCDTGETLIENPWRDNPHIDALVDAIEQLPSVNPQEPKTGHWIDTGSGQECSECHEIQYGYDSNRKYCANCGVRMESEE